MKNSLLGCIFIFYLWVPLKVLFLYMSMLVYNWVHLGPVYFVTFIDNRKRRRRASSLVMSKKKRRLLPFSPTEDHTRRMQQMASLATALTATGTKFSNELTYRPRMAPRSANCAALEQGGMQVCCKQ